MNKRQKEVLEYFLDREEQVIRGLKAVYRQAIRDCEERIRQLSTRSDLENIQSIVYQTQYQQAIQRQLEGILDILQTNEFTTISDYLNAAYQNGFAGALYDLHGQGIPLLFPIDQDQVTKAVLNDSKLSVPMYTRLGEDVNTLKLAVRAQISRGIAGGSTWNQMAQELAQNMVNSPFQTAQYNAMRIARTEGHRIQQQSQYDAMRKAKEHGADVVKEWNATLDARTRPDHMSLDGQIREIGDPFTLGSLKAQYPGDFGRPEQDIHCRCCALQRARWALGEKELEQLKERAKYLGLDQAKDFEGFQKRYLDAQNSGLLSLYQPAGQYLNQSGEFDLDTAKEDYLSLLQSAPEKNRIYLEQALDAVEYRKTQNQNVTFGYSAKNDALVYNPSAPGFSDLDFSVAMNHELSHRVDEFLANSWENQDFSGAIAAGKEIIRQNPQEFLDYAKHNDKDGPLSDILDAISESEYRFPFRHDADYWGQEGVKEKEIFANLFTLEALQDTEKLHWFREHFPDIWSAYQTFEF